MTPEEAVALARRSHDGQIDKAGKPYIDHVMRVMDAVTTPREKIAAALHDVVEDSAVTLENLRRLGCPDEVVEPLRVDASTGAHHVELPVTTGKPQEGSDCRSVR